VTDNRQQGTSIKLFKELREPQGQLSLHEEGVSLGGREQLVDRVQRLYDDHSEGLVRYLLHLGRTPEQADDFLQEAFLRMLEALQRGKRIEKPKSWLFAVLHHIQVDEARRNRRTVALDDTPIRSSAFSPEEDMLQDQRARRLESAMTRLTARQYQYLILRTEGLKLREIAEIFGVTVQSVAEACTRGIEHLGRAMHD